MIATSVSQIIQEPKNIEQKEDVILNISDEQKTQYLTQNFESGKCISEFNKCQLCQDKLAQIKKYIIFYRRI